MPLAAPAVTLGSVKYLGFWGLDSPAEMRSFTNLAFASSAADAAANRAAGLTSLLKLTAPPG